MLKQIGILGGNGTVGNHLTRLLSKHINVQIKVSIRTDNFIKLEYPNIKYEKINLNDLYELKQFIRGCDIVINCTGYHNKNIISCCLKYHSHYIDSSGTLDLSLNEKELNQELVQKHLSAVQFVGVNPGLTEVMISYCEEQWNINKLELYFSGVGTLSRSAIHELIETSEPPYSYSQMYIKDTKLEKLNYIVKEVKLLNNTEPLYCIPVINRHFISCIKQTNISSAYFFNTFNNKNIIYKMVEAKILYQKNEIEKSILLLMNAFRQYGNNSRSYTMIKVILNESYDFTFRSSLNWNELTAMTIYYTVILFSRNKIKEYGIKSLHEVIESKDLLIEMKKNPDLILEINN